MKKINTSWLNYTNNEHYKIKPVEKIKDEYDSLTNIANALAHMNPSDRNNYDDRTYIISVHLSKFTYQHHSKIIMAQKMINKALINHFKYGSTGREDKIGIINSIDYSGSRTGSKEATSGSLPHLHITLIFPKKLYSFLEPSEIPQEITTALVDLSVVQPYELNDNGDIISHGIYVEKFSPVNPVWYVANYNSKFSQKTSGCDHSTIISPRDEMIEKFDTIRKGRNKRAEIHRGERKKKNFKSEVDKILRELRKQPKRYYLHKASIDWCDETSDYARNNKLTDIVIPRSKFKKITRIKEVIDDYISACMNCYVRGLALPLALNGIEILLRQEFLESGGVDKWMWQQSRSQYWYDYWCKMWGVDVDAA